MEYNEYKIIGKFIKSYCEFYRICINPTKIYYEEYSSYEEYKCDNIINLLNSEPICVVDIIKNANLNIINVEKATLIYRDDGISGFILKMNNSLYEKIFFTFNELIIYEENYEEINLNLIERL